MKKQLVQVSVRFGDSPEFPLSGPELLGIQFTGDESGIRQVMRFMQFFKPAPESTIWNSLNEYSKNAIFTWVEPIIVQVLGKDEDTNELIFQLYNEQTKAHITFCGEIAVYRSNEQTAVLTVTESCTISSRVVTIPPGLVWKG